MMRFLVSILVFLLSFGNGFCQSPYYEDYLIPNEYVGYVRVVHEVEDAPSLPIENGRIIYKFDGTGILKTSDKVRVGSIYPKYYYYTDKEKTLLPNRARGAGGMIHNGVVANAVNLIFFVGTEYQMSLWVQSDCGKKEDNAGYLPKNIKQCLEDFENSQKEKPQTVNQPK